MNLVAFRLASSLASVIVSLSTLAGLSLGDEAAGKSPSATEYVVVDSPAFPMATSSPALGTTLAPPDGNQISQNGTHNPTRLTLIGGSSAQRTEVLGAAERFEENGLVLPDLTIRFHADRNECNGGNGVFNLRGAGSDVDLCDGGQFLVLHELAHAWAYGNLTDSDRDEFVRSAGLDTWNSHDAPHGRRATEVAADAIAFGLADRPLTTDSARRSLRKLQIFVDLTGFESSRPDATLEELEAMPPPTIDPAIVAMYSQRPSGT